MGLSRIFDISRRSLATYQKAMDITSHNVANASNEDYTRQRVKFATENPETTANFIWGTGVKLSDVERVRSSLIDAQLRNSYANYYNNEQESLLLSQVEQVFSEPSDLGISNIMTEFFNSWNKLSVSANSMSLRYEVVQSAQQLTDRIKLVYDNLNAISYDSMRNFSDKVDSVNSKLQQIQQLNVQVVEAAAVGLSANDIMDQRDKLIDELSQMANVSVITDSTGAANVSIGGIQALDASGYIEFETREINGSLTMVIKGTDTSVTLSGGELCGISTVYSKRVPEYLETLDEISNKLMETVNQIHSTGYTLEENPVSGLDFFESYSDGDLVINPDILNDAAKIAISKDGTEGNGELAADIANIATAKVLNGLTLGDNYSRMISKLGNDKQNADNISESTNLVIEQLEVQKGSISGVSLDEEMTNIIKFQRSYDASARLITVADEMLETIINMV